MAAGTRLVVYLGALVAIFALAFIIGTVAVPDSVVEAWTSSGQGDHA